MITLFSSRLSERNTKMKCDSMRHHNLGVGSLLIRSLQRILFKGIADWRHRIQSRRQFSLWDEQYKASQNIPNLNSFSIALSVLKYSDVTHTDSTPLNLAVPCRGYQRERLDKAALQHQNWYEFSSLAPQHSTGSRKGLLTTTVLVLTLFGLD